MIFHSNTPADSSKFSMGILIEEIEPVVTEINGFEKLILMQGTKWTTFKQMVCQKMKAVDWDFDGNQTGSYGGIRVRATRFFKTNGIFCITGQSGF